MANVLIESQTMTDIANAIREKNGTDVKMKPAEMPQAVRDIKSEDTGIGSRQWWLDICKEKKSFAYMFYKTTIETIPPIDTSNGTNFEYMFQSCPNLRTVPPIDTSKGTYFNNMFGSCFALKTIPPIDTSNGTSFSNMFNSCRELISVPTLDVSKGTGFNNMFIYCYQLQDISFVKESIHKTINFWTSDKLTDESIQSIIDGLADLTGQTAQTLTFSSTVKNKLTEEQIASATSKNWNIA